MMTVLVTGGSGCIGRFVVEELVDRGHDVDVYDLREPDVPGADWIEGDVTDPDAVESAVDGVDAVVTMAALLPAACEEDPVTARRVNVGGLQHVLEAAGTHGVRVAFVSSKGAIGQVTGRHAHPRFEPLGPDAPREPLTAYGRTKLAGEHWCEWYRENRGVDVAAVRFSSTYGPGQGTRYGNLAVVSSLINRATSGEAVTVTGGDQRDDLIYLGDIGRGIADLIDADEWSYPTYHLGSGDLVTLRDVAAAVESHVPDADITVEAGLNFREQTHPSYALMDIARARDDLGYAPAFDVDAGVSDFVDRLD